LNYSSFISSRKVNFEIKNNIVKCGSSTWQISNIAAASIMEIVVPFKESKPCLPDAEPKFRVNFKKLIFIALAVWLTMKFLFHFPKAEFIEWVSVCLAICISLYISYNNYKKEMQHWAKIKDVYFKKIKKWEELKNNPIRYFRLKLETNAGSKTLFNSFDSKQIARAKESIEESMNKEKYESILQIDALQVEQYNINGENNINNFRSEVYGQILNGV